jgi:hypothetical protein
MARAHKKRYRKAQKDQLYARGLYAEVVERCYKTKPDADILTKPTFHHNGSMNWSRQNSALRELTTNYWNSNSSGPWRWRSLCMST